MTRLTTDTRPDSTTTGHPDTAAVYVQSYLLTRMIVGILAFVLPFIFIVGEAYYLKGGVHVRGSISAYYHTSMRDIFVASLCVVGFLLVTYMSGQTKTPEFRYSLVAGLAVLGVVFFPTWRPGLADGAPKCGAVPMPDGCSPIQQVLGEAPVAWFHFGCAVVFILSLARISFLFAHREKIYHGKATMASFQKIFGSVIVGAVAWALVGEMLNVTIWELTPLYLGEVVSVWAFGASWLLKSKDLRGALRLGHQEGRSIGHVTALALDAISD